MPELKVFTNPSGPTSWKVEGQRFVIGRESTCDVVLDDPLASRRHAAVERGPDVAFLIKDLASRNGILINGKRTPEHVLVDGDVIRIGRTDIQFARTGMTDDFPVLIDAYPLKGDDVSTVMKAPDPAAAPVVEEDLARQTTRAASSFPLKPETTSTATPLQDQGSGVERPLNDWVLNPGLEVAFPDASGKPGEVNLTPSPVGPASNWAFLGIGHYGDLIGSELLALGHRRFLVVLEGLVPPARIAAPAPNVVRIAEGGEITAIGEEMQLISGTLETLHGPKDRRTTDLFLLASSETFDEAAATVAHVTRIRQALKLTLGGRPRLHAVLVRPAAPWAGGAPGDLKGWQMLMQTGAVSSVLLVDRTHPLFGAEESAPTRRRLAANVAGTLDTFARLARQTPTAGRFGVPDLETLSTQGGFGALGVAQSQKCDPLAFARAVDFALSNALTAQGIPQALARSVGLIAVAGREMVRRPGFAQSFLETARATAQARMPQARPSIVLHEDAGSTLRLFVWVSGISA